MNGYCENWLYSLFEHITPLLQSEQYLRNGKLCVILKDYDNNASKNTLKLLETILEKWNNILILQFDEIQLWSTQPYSFDPEEKITNLRTSISKFFLRSLSFKLSQLQIKFPKIKIVLTGTDLKMGEMIRSDSSIKTEIFSLPYWTDESILILLKAACRFDKIGITDEDILKKVASQIVGPVRNVEYFLDEVSTLTKSVDKITLNDLENCVKFTLKKWIEDMLPLFNRAVEKYASVMDELLIAWMLSTPDENHPDNAIKISVSSLPRSWYELNNAGVIRLQELEPPYIYRMWKPYPFLLEYWRRKFTIFHFEDVAGLYAEILAGQSDPNKRKGFCFQRAGNFFFLNLKNQNTLFLLKTSLKKLHLNC